jgi:hypothetical protein
MILERALRCRKYFAVYVRLGVTVKSKFRMYFTMRHDKSHAIVAINQYIIGSLTQAIIEREALETDHGTILLVDLQAKETKNKERYKEFLNTTERSSH